MYKQHVGSACGDDNLKEKGKRLGGDYLLYTLLH